MKEFLFKLYKLFKKLPYFMARRVLIIILIAILADAALGVILFYAYAVLPDKMEPEISKDSLGFRDDLYIKIQSQWQAREQKIQEFSQKNYSNPFVKP